MTEVLEADEYLIEFMKAQVRERKAVIGSKTPSERKAGSIQTDVFTMLVRSNEDESGKLKLDDEELVRRWTLPPISSFFLFFWKLYSACNADWQYLRYVVCWSW